MKEAKIQLIIEGNDIFTDVKHFEEYRKSVEGRPGLDLNYGGLLLGLGRNVFLFDMNSCDYFDNKKEKNE